MNAKILKINNQTKTIALSLSVLGYDADEKVIRTHIKYANILENLQYRYNHVKIHITTFLKNSNFELSNSKITVNSKEDSFDKIFIKYINKHLTINGDELINILNTLTKETHLFYLYHNTSSQTYDEGKYIFVLKKVKNFNNFFIIKLLLKTIYNIKNIQSINDIVFNSELDLIDYLINIINSKNFEYTYVYTQTSRKLSKLYSQVRTIYAFKNSKIFNIDHDLNSIIKHNEKHPDVLYTIFSVAEYKNVRIALMSKKLIVLKSHNGLPDKKIKGINDDDILTKLDYDNDLIIITANTDSPLYPYLDIGRTFFTQSNNSYISYNAPLFDIPFDLTKIPNINNISDTYKIKNHYDNIINNLNEIKDISYRYVYHNHKFRNNKLTIQPITIQDLSNALDLHNYNVKKLSETKRLLEKLKQVIRKLRKDGTSFKLNDVIYSGNTINYQNQVIEFIDSNVFSGFGTPQNLASGMFEIIEDHIKNNYSNYNYNKYYYSLDELKKKIPDEDIIAQLEDSLGSFNEINNATFDTILNLFMLEWGNLFVLADTHHITYHIRTFSIYSGPTLKLKVKRNFYKTSLDDDEFLEKLLTDGIYTHWKIGTVDVVHSIKFSKNKNDVLSIKHYINGIKLTSTDIFSAFYRAIAFTNTDDYNKFLKRISTVPLKIDFLLHFGYKLDITDDINTEQYKIVIPVTREKNRNYLHINNVKKKIKNINKLLAYQNKNKKNDVDATSLQSLVNLLTNEDILEPFTKQELNGLIQSAIKARENIDKTRKELVDSAIKSTKAIFHKYYTVNNKNFNDVYEIKGQNRSYIIQSYEPYNVFSVPEGRYICMLDKVVNSIPEIKFANRLFALANDSVVASKVKTLNF